MPETRRDLPLDLLVRLQSTVGNKAVVRLLDVRDQPRGVAPAVPAPLPAQPAHLESPPDWHSAWLLWAATGLAAASAVWGLVRPGEWFAWLPSLAAGLGLASWWSWPKQAPRAPGRPAHVPPGAARP
jgi:hypothetical protein